MDLYELKQRDTFTSDDIIEAIEEFGDDDGLNGEELEGEDLELARKEAGDNEDLQTLKDFAEEAESSFSDWKYGETFIRHTYFEDYARELADDTRSGSVSFEQWPYNCIDWDEAADQLRSDYSEIDLDGVTFLARSY